MQTAELTQDTKRVIIEGVQPEIDGGRFPIKRSKGESVAVEADIFTDGRDVIPADLLIGSDLIQSAAQRASGADQAMLEGWAELLASDKSVHKKIKLALDVNLARLVTRYPDRSHATRYAKILPVTVDRLKARFSSWYEMFPRSCGPNDPGSPWAIGAAEGGHRAVHSQLGTLEEFRQLIRRAEEFGIDVALDIAFQCIPDHPYVQEHPEWFYPRPDGSIQYAENPPKKYEDIYPLNFENDRWQDLWQELLGVVHFWIDQGIRIFRVDNPHTRPFAFWKWLIAEVKKDFPETIFLAEAFTRPRVMHRLAKLGFTQSYTYFAWRNSKSELTQYFTELSRAPVREFFRPNLWPNTPDILTEYLQMGGRAAFAVRLVLAATLGANYGIYGPAFELAENTPREPHSEEYLDSEKYQIRSWEVDRPDSLKPFIARVNRIRRENAALQTDRNLNFHPLDNEQLIAYSKHTDDLANIILAVVNLDPHHTHSGWLEFSRAAVGLDPKQSFQVHDLLSDARYRWQGSPNFVELNPQIVPAHIFVVRRKVRTERDFDYFL